MAKIRITTRTEAERALYTEIHMTMGWTYQQIWLELAGSPGPTKLAFIAAGMNSLPASAWKIVGEIWNMGAEIEFFAPKSNGGCGREGKGIFCGRLGATP